MCSCGFLFFVPAVITPGLLSEVDRFGWNVFGVTVGGESDNPSVIMNALLMNDVMVQVAEQDTVAEVGFAALGPGIIRVMDFARPLLAALVGGTPIGWPVATGERLPQTLRAGRCPAAVPVGDGDALVAGEESFAPSHVQGE